MKKFLLVILIGMVLVLDVYGFVKERIDHVEETENVVDRHVTIVYVE